MKENIPYWLVMTAFGNGFDNKDTFKIKFGECGIDDYFVFGFPRIIN